MDISIFDIVFSVILVIFSSWIYFSWANSRFNDEENDITDASCSQEYLIRKFVRFFKKK